MTLRIHIDGRWDAADFADFFRSLDELHSFYSILSQRSIFLDQVYADASFFSRRSTDYSLTINKVQFASPGSTDLAGVAAALREMREFIQFVITKWMERPDRKLERDKKEVEIALLKVNLLKELQSVSNDSQASIPSGALEMMHLKDKRLPNIDGLIEAIVEDRITSVEELD